VDRVFERGRDRLQGVAQGHAVRGDQAAINAGNTAKTYGLPVGRGEGKGARLGVSRRFAPCRRSASR